MTISPIYSSIPDTVIWQLNSSLFDCQSACREITFFPTATGPIIAEAVDENGCSYNDTLFLTVEEIRNAFFPNAFSPNGDNRNDYFTIYGSVPNVKSIESLNIYDRWGSLVFSRESFAPNIEQLGWDGRIGEIEASNGVYI